MNYWRFYPEGLMVSYSFALDKLPSLDFLVERIRFASPVRQLARGRWWREGTRLVGYEKLTEEALPSPAPGRREVPRAGQNRFWGEDGEDLLALESERDFHREWEPMREQENCQFLACDLPAESSAELLALADRYLLPVAKRVNPIDGAELVECGGQWFYRYPVTVRQYRKVMRHMPDAPSFGWDNHHPMVLVTFEEASRYSEAVGARLPSEAEWQRLAGEGTFPWGDEPDASRCTIGAKATSWIDRRPDGVSPCGALDLAGNVCEWTTDQVKGKRVVKGGNFRSKSLDECRCEARRLVNHDTLKPWLGFRCVMLS